MGSRPFGPQAGVAIHGRTCRRAESDRLRSPRISTELEKEIGKGEGTKGRVGNGREARSGHPRFGTNQTARGACNLPNFRNQRHYDSGGAECKDRIPKMFSGGAQFASSRPAPSPLPATYCQRALYGFDSGTTRCQLPPGRFRCRCRHSKKPRPQTRERQGAWSVDAGRGQRGVQSDVRRDGGGRRRHQRRRGARGRRGRGRRSSAPFRFPCCHWHRKDSQST